MSGSLKKTVYALSVSLIMLSIAFGDIVFINLPEADSMK